MLTPFPVGRVGYIKFVVNIFPFLHFPHYRHALLVLSLCGGGTLVYLPVPLGVLRPQ